MPSPAWHGLIICMKDCAVLQPPDSSQDRTTQISLQLTCRVEPVGACYTCVAPYRPLRKFCEGSWIPRRAGVVRL